VYGIIYYNHVLKTPPVRSRTLITIVFSLHSIVSAAQDNLLSKKQIQEDLAFLAQVLDEKSSYVYLNGYDFHDDFEHYLQSIEDSVRLENFGLFLTKTMGKIGDRHSSLTTIRGYTLKESLFLPFVYAPENGRVVVLNSARHNELELLSTDFPYLKKIGGISIDDFLRNTRPEDIRAPKDTYFTMAVRDIRDIQKNYLLLSKPLPKEIKLTLSNSTFESDTTFTVPVIDKSKRLRPWDEKFERDYVLVKDEDFNKPEVIDKLFLLENDIAYIRLPEMANKDEAPLLFDKLHSFMASIQQNSKALIIDVRSNSGGTRDLMYDFARYLVHPDSLYVINATRQRGPLPLPVEYDESLNARFLYPLSELNSREQKKVTSFLETFKPMYKLDNNKYSEYYFGLLNGKKLAEPSSYYQKPVYILANEKTFSAASVFVAAFKGLPNIQIAGVTTDGSSGNTEWFDLPNSKLFGKISTMVSFQKDGIILDGHGTAPDIEIERDLDQILFKSDHQLEELKSLIRTEK